MATTPFPPRRHSSEGWNPGRRRRGGEGMAGFTGWRIRLSPRDCHSRYAGMYKINHWIPACAGMTEEAKVKNLPRIATGLSE